MPESLKRIGVEAFKGCHAQCEINIPNSLAEVGKYAFDSCWKLGTISFSPEVRRFGSEIFIDDVCGNHTSLRNALMEIWNSRTSRTYWSDDGFKETVYALDLDAEVTFLDRRFILWSFDDEMQKYLTDEDYGRFA